jgi:hypothetical protein
MSVFMYSSPTATVANHHRFSGLNNVNYSPTALEVRSLRWVALEPKRKMKEFAGLCLLCPLKGRLCLHLIDAAYLSSLLVVFLHLQSSHITPASPSVLTSPLPLLPTSYNFPCDEMAQSTQVI